MNPAKGGSRLDDFDFKHTFKGKDNLNQESRMKMRDIEKEERMELDKKELVMYSSSNDSDMSEASDNVEDLLKELEHKDPIELTTEFKLKRNYEDTRLKGEIEITKNDPYSNDIMDSIEYKRFMAKMFR